MARVNIAQATPAARQVSKLSQGIELVKFSDLRIGDCVELSGTMTEAVDKYLAYNILDTYSNGTIYGGCDYQEYDLAGITFQIIFHFAARVDLPSTIITAKNGKRIINRCVQLSPSTIREIIYMDKNIQLTRADEETANQFYAIFNNSSRPSLPKMHLKSGTDPEIFTRRGDGRLLLAWEFLPAEDKKLSVGNRDTVLVYNSEIFYDGAQAELTTNAQGCHDSLLHGIHHGLKGIIDKARIIDPKATLDWRSVVELDKPTLCSADDKYLALGCAPSLNIYPDTEAIQIENPRLLDIRFAGCHIHQQLEASIQKDRDHITQIVYLMDLVGGIIMTAALGPTDDPRRRQYYGRAGEYRLPAHGLEYRTISSAVLMAPWLTYLAFDTVRMGFTLGVNGLSRLAPDDIKPDMVQSIINNTDYKSARQLVNKHKEFYHWVLTIIYSAPNTNAHNNAWRLINEGADKLIDGTCMADHWNLNDQHYDYSRKRLSAQTF